ncbi:DUF2934 domain-containing protein [Dongia sp. agr-C8]
MDWSREEEIRKRAQRIWEEEGKPEGKDAQHWAQAERELDMASSQGGETGNAGGFAEGSKTERTAEDLRSANRR